MFRNEMYQRDMDAIPMPIIFFSNKELLQTYTSILIDLESAGVYEPVAQGIREEWAARGLNKRILNKVDKRFKNLKREQLK